MPALLCDICGGNLMVDAGGKTATCQFCGAQHSMERMREKTQEIKDKVTIERSVTVDGVAGIESLLVRAWEFYKNRDLEKASEYYNRILDIDPNQSTAREMLDLISGQAAKLEKECLDEKRVKLFGAYDAKVTDIDQCGCTVTLLASNRPAYIHISEISDPPPKRTADAISEGEILQVTVIDENKNPSTGQVRLSASLLPPEEHAGYCLSLNTVDMMKEALKGGKCSARMVRETLSIIERLEDSPPPSLSKSAIEDRLIRCEFLLSHAIHNDQNYIALVLEYFAWYCRSATGRHYQLAVHRLSVDGWKTTEMRSEMHQAIHVGQKNASILSNRDFFRRVVRYLDKDQFYRYIDKDPPYRQESCFEHTDYDSEDVCSSSIIPIDDNDFVYGHTVHSRRSGWHPIPPFALPDLETLEEWHQNYLSKRCFAGGDLSFWSQKSSICGCTPDQCRRDNPQCPLNH